MKDLYDGLAEILYLIDADKWGQTPSPAEQKIISIVADGLRRKDRALATSDNARIKHITPADVAAMRKKATLLGKKPSHETVADLLGISRSTLLRLLKK